MADRMRVTSFMGDTERLEGPCGTSSPQLLAWVANLSRPRTSNRLSRRVFPATREIVDEYTSRLATNPQFLRQVARHRAVGKPALPRRQAAAPPSVRGPHWTSPRMVDTQLRVSTHPWRSIMARKRRSYTPEFKAEAVKLVTEQGYAVAEAARSLGITENLIRNWRQALQAHGEQTFLGQGKPSAAEDELRRLRAENKRLLAERDILKKAAAFFAREAT